MTARKPSWPVCERRGNSDLTTCGQSPKERAWSRGGKGRRKISCRRCSNIIIARRAQELGDALARFAGNLPRSHGEELRSTAASYGIPAGGESA